MRLSRPPLLLLLLLLLTLSVGCNEPPLYGTRAREFLRAQGIPSETIEKLTTTQPLDPEEAERLSHFENVGVLHLLGRNPGTPQAILAALARHRNSEVRTGVASNPELPLELLLSLRTPGEYTTVNSAVAGNPRLPPAVIREMHRNGEAGYLDFAMNTSCPQELMREIAAKGDWLARGFLAQNPSIPGDVVQKLAQDRSEDVRMRLTFNPRLPAAIVCRLDRDESELVRDHVETRIERELYPHCDRSAPITDPIAYLHDPIAYRKCAPSRRDMVKEWCGRAN